MERVIVIAVCLGLVSSIVNLENLHHVLRKRQADSMIDFNAECSALFSTMDKRCLNNIFSLIETYKSVEKEAVAEWGDQCSDNIYDCIASPDAETKQVIKYFKILLPEIKALCADGCMIPIIDLIHSCLKAEYLSSIGISRSEMEDIFDLVCIQEDGTGGEEGEYCMLKAMTTATYLTEAQPHMPCNLDGIDLTTCGSGDDSLCTCSANCSMLITNANANMGCCMGTLLELENKFKLTHPANDDLMNPGSKLFQLCNIEAAPACTTSKETIDAQNAVYENCYNVLRENANTQCIRLEDQVHTTYLAEMQHIMNVCTDKKNIGVCKDSSTSIPISDDLKSVLKQLNNHCGECGPELAGIRDNCTVFLPNEAKMVFEMMCLRNTDMEHCGTKIIDYEAKRERPNLDSNPCFQGIMPSMAMQCNPDCLEEVKMMNSYGVLNCFDALMDYTVSPLSEWQIWHKNCIRQSGIEVNNRINVTRADFNIEPKAQVSQHTILKTIAFTFVGTVVLGFIVAMVVVVIYKKQMILGMFGYSKFNGQDNLITDVNMDDTMGDFEEDRGENYYD